jgi:DNA-binding transcriptional MocR family regulator
MIMSAGEHPSRSRLLKNLLRDRIMHSRNSVSGHPPSEAELMEEFSVSRATVHQVFSELSLEGLIEKQKGRGRTRTHAKQSRRPAHRSMLVGVWFNWPLAPPFELIAEGILCELQMWKYNAVFGAGGLEVGT